MVLKAIASWPISSRRPGSIGVSKSPWASASAPLSMRFRRRAMKNEARYADDEREREAR